MHGPLTDGLWVGEEGLTYSRSCGSPCILYGVTERVMLGSTPSQALC